MPVLIFIVIISILAGRVVYEYIQERNDSKHKVNYAAFQLVYCAGIFKDFNVYKDNPPMTQMIDEIPHAYLKFVFGEGWEELLRNDNSTYTLTEDNTQNGFLNVYNVVYNIWLAHTMKRIHPLFLSAYEVCFNIEGLPHERRHDVAMRTCWLIEKILYNGSDSSPKLYHLMSIKGETFSLCWKPFLDTLAINRMYLERPWTENKSEYEPKINLEL